MLKSILSRGKPVFPIFVLLALFWYGCKHDPPEPKKAVDGNFPPEVARIMITKCATAGCHNELSYTAAGGLRLDDWEHLFNGGANGSTIIPFSTEHSPLLFFINPDSNLGITMEPRMPKDAPPLSVEEYMTIKDWIAAGAPNKHGKLPYSENPETRQKIYMTMQGCDIVGVIDAETHGVMKYINVGIDNGIESAHTIKFDPQGKYAYVSFTNGRAVQRINATTDEVDGQVILPPGGSYNTFHISQDGKEMMLTNMSNPGSVLLIDLETMTLKQIYEGYISPHGISANPGFDTFYITGQYGNFIYQMDKSGFYQEQISIDDNPPSITSSRNPHEVMMHPDFSRYYLTCEFSHEVRVIDRVSAQVVKVIPVGTMPKEFSISRKYPYLYVSCEEDHVVPPAGKINYKGSIYRINYETDEVDGEVIKGKFSNVHGLVVDDLNGTLYFASRNVSNDGPPPHHTSACGGTNGYYQVYDMLTLQPRNNKRYEVLTDPYSMDVRFKYNP